MKHILKISILGFIFLSFTFSMPSLVIEGEVGGYKPSDPSYEGQQSRRYAGIVGLDIKFFELYGGYKIWSNGYSKYDLNSDRFKYSSSINTALIGIRKNINIYNGLGLRLGTAVLFSDTEFNLKYYDSESSENNYNIPIIKSIGCSLQGGLTQTFKNLRLSLGMNYLLLNPVKDKKIFPSDGSTLTFTGDDRIFDASGVNIKFTVGYSIEVSDIIKSLKKLIEYIEESSRKK